MNLEGPMVQRTKSSYEFGEFVLDPREQCLLHHGKDVSLTPKVFRILLALVEHRGHILSVDEIMKLVWPNTAVEDGNVARNISTLRTALGERSREQKYIQTVPWRGYRFVGEVKEARLESTPTVINSIAVLPFVNQSGDPKLEYLADGLSETLINKLSQLSQLKVMSRNSTFRYRGRDVNATAIGRELNVQAVLTGRIALHDQMFSISLELIDASDESHIWGAQHLRHKTDIMLLQELIAAEVIVPLRVHFSGEDGKKLSRRHTENMEAYEHYLKGRFYFNKISLDGVQKAVEHFNKAVVSDPYYGLAYAGLADAYNYLSKPDDAKLAVNKALELDDSLGEAHASLGFFKFVYDWDFIGAETQFKQAIALRPNYSEAHHWSAIYFANVCRHEEAAEAARRAIELDPLSLLVNMTPGLTAYLARDYERAVTEIQKVIEMESNFPAAHSVLAGIRVQQGAYAAAIDHYRRVLELTQTSAVVENAVKTIMGYAYAKWGKRKKALALLDEAIKASDSADSISPHSVAEIYIALDQRDEAFEWLNRAYDLRDPQLVSLKANPTLDPLRSDPRFNELVARVGLPQ